VARRQAAALRDPGRIEDERTMIGRSGTTIVADGRQGSRRVAPRVRTVFVGWRHFAARGRATVLPGSRTARRQAAALQDAGRRAGGTITVVLF
jgi:hypothetical protein